jgi:hypothetical protein
MLLNLIVEIIIIALIYWLVTFLPLPAPAGAIINVIFIIILILVVLSAFGLFGAVTPVKLL